MSTVNNELEMLHIVKDSDIQDIQDKQDSEPSNLPSASSSQNRELKRRRVYNSSETQGLGEGEDSIVMEEDEDMVESIEELERRAEVFTSTFMDKIDVCWDEIVQRLLKSEFWINREESLNMMDSEVQALKGENAELKRRLMLAEGRLTRAEKELELTKEKVIDLTSRSMRDNLIIKNVEESRGEDIEEKIKNVLKDNVKMDDNKLTKVDILSCHRIGKYHPKHTRSIVARFTRKSKALVMQHLKNLKDDESGVKIQEQYPPEIHMRRSKLWPQFIQAKQNNQEARFITDKLLVDNMVINPPKDRITNINTDVTKTALDISLKAKHTPVMTLENNSYQGHTIPVESADDVIPAIQALCSDQRVAGSSHIVYAYRIGREGSFISNFEDDGDWGGGREIMAVLEKHKLFNHVVAVSRWNGGRMSGQSRFKHIQATAEAAVVKLA
jgi:hypothetical protein